MSLNVASTGTDARRLLELLAVLLVSASAIGLLLLRLGMFDAAPVWVAGALCVFWYCHVTAKRPALDNYPIPAWHLVVVVLIGLLFRLPPYAYILGGQDQGIYMNAAMELARTGSLLPVDPVMDRISDPAILETYRHSNYIGDYLPGIYSTPEGLRFQFYHLFPVWLALFGDGFGPQLAVYGLTFLSLVSLLFFYRLAQLITGSASAGLLAGVLLATNPLHAFFSKFPVTEVPTLAFSLMSFSLLLSYWRTPHSEGGRRLIWLSAAAMTCLFFTRISGFMYMPFVAAISIIGALYDTNMSRTRGLVAWTAVVFAGYAASIAYGLKWSSSYSNDIYRLSFGMLAGIDGKSLLFTLMVVGVIAWLLALAGARHSATAPAGRALLSAGQRFLPYVGILVALVGAYRAYRLGYTDAYASDAWVGQRFGLSHQGVRALMSTSLIASAIYLSPFIFLAYFSAAFSARRSVLVSALLLFTTFFIGVVLLLQGVLAYQPYYARYLVSEWIPYALLLVVCGCVADERARGRLGAALLLGGLFCAGLSFAQIGKQEHAGVSESMESLTARFDSGDLILIDGAMNAPAAHELKTSLRFTYGLNVATVTRKTLDPEYVVGLAGPYDDVYLLANTDYRIAGFHEVDSVRFTEHAYKHAASPPMSLVARNDGKVRIFKFNAATADPLRLHAGFGQRRNGNAMLTDGWSTPEPWGVWSNGKLAHIEVDASALDLTGAKALVLTLSGRAFVTGKSPRQRITVLVAGTQVGTAVVEYPKTHVELKTELPVDSIGSGRRLLLELQLPDATAPRTLGYSADARILAFGVERITLEAKQGATALPDG
jgi:hypothetical protein